MRHHCACNVQVAHLPMSLTTEHVKVPAGCRPIGQKHHPIPNVICLAAEGTCTKFTIVWGLVKIQWANVTVLQ